jgi:hypothetical protein
MTWCIPRVPPNYGNSMGMRRGRLARESKMDKRVTAASFLASDFEPPQLPAKVRLTLFSHSASRMDSDNLRIRLKYIRDEVSRCFGAADDHDGKHITWFYGAGLHLPKRFHASHGRYGVLVTWEEEEKTE